jgi:hypothetical protein
VREPVDAAGLVPAPDALDVPAADADLVVAGADGAGAGTACVGAATIGPVTIGPVTIGGETGPGDGDVVTRGGVVTVTGGGGGTGTGGGGTGTDGGGGGGSAVVGKGGGGGGGGSAVVTGSDGTVAVTPGVGGRSRASAWAVTRPASAATKPKSIPRRDILNL